jgi:predicted alpha/beta superfamily hydrolase
MAALKNRCRRTFRRLSLVVLGGALAGVSCAGYSNDNHDDAQVVQDSIVVPYAMASEPPRSFRAEGYDYDHEVLVTLPRSYTVSPDRSYPVLWAMDGAAHHMIIAGIVSMYGLYDLVPEMIIVSVGHSSEQGIAGIAKRSADLTPPGSLLGDDELGKSTLRAGYGSSLTDLETSQPNGANFLDFLVDQLRPQMAERYRMNGDHALVGHSLGGWFTGYALFTRPDAFSRYLIASGIHHQTLDHLEAKYAESHDDLPARIFIAAGSSEVTNVMLSAVRAVSRTVALAENLSMRQYPSLALKLQLYPDRDHITVLPPLFADGFQYIYADEVEKLTNLTE